MVTHFNRWSNPRRQDHRLALWILAGPRLDRSGMTWAVILFLRRPGVLLPDRLPVDLRSALGAEVEPSEACTAAAVCVLPERVLFRVEALVVPKQRIGA